MKNRLLLPLLLLPLATGCVGTRQNGDTTTVHAESFHLFGLTIPEDDREAAWEQVPEGAEVITTASDPLDWTSVIGVLNHLFGLTATQITYRAPAGG